MSTYSTGTGSWLTVFSGVLEEADYLIMWGEFYFHGLQVGVTIALTIKRERTSPFSLTL